MMRALLSKIMNTGTKQKQKKSFPYSKTIMFLALLKFLKECGILFQKLNNTPLLILNLKRYTRVTRYDERKILNVPLNRNIENTVL